MAEMMLLADRQALMRNTAAGLIDGTVSRKEARKTIRQLQRMEEQSAEGSRATIDRSAHDHVKKSGQAALRNRLATIDLLNEALGALTELNNEVTAEALIQAAATGGKKSVKAARKAPTVALYVQYLAETDSDFQDWLTRQGIKA